jgi:hypothetical protein
MRGERVADGGKRVADGGEGGKRVADGGEGGELTQDRGAAPGQPAGTARLAVHRALAHVASRSSGPPLDPALRVTLNFHPDRLTSAGEPILDTMGRDGLYRSQFETGTSNGGLTAYEGGDRWSWESRIFGTAYDGAPACDRPKYGSLNFRRRPVGGSPRFGSSHLRLRPETLNRTTFCYPDSFLQPVNFGVAQAMSLIELAEADDKDFLDDYIEAHVHGPIRTDADVEALVLDPSFRGTAVAEAAERLGCPVEWHDGFELSTAELRRHPDFRGPEFVKLGAELAVDGRLDARIIGDASRTRRYDDQDLKRVWHYVARFGHPY